MERVRRTLGERTFVLVIWTRWLRVVCVCVRISCVRVCGCVCGRVRVFAGGTVCFFWGGRAGSEHWYVGCMCVWPLWKRRICKIMGRARTTLAERKFVLMFWIRWPRTSFVFGAHKQRPCVWMPCVWMRVWLYVCVFAGVTVCIFSFVRGCRVCGCVCGCVCACL